MLIAVAFAIGFRFCPALAQELSTSKTGDFVNWCVSNGVTARDSKGTTCANSIGIHVSVIAGLGSAAGCRKLRDESKNGDPDELGALTAQPIVRWLHANSQNLTNYLNKDLDAALWALYQCY